MPARALALRLAALLLVVAGIGRLQSQPCLAQELKERVTLKGETLQLFSMALTPDGTTLATGGGDKYLGGQVKLWDRKTGKEGTTLDCQQFIVLAVAFSADGKTLATGSNKLQQLGSGVKLWNVATGKERAALGEDDAVTSLAFAPDGKTLASGSMFKTVKLWDVNAGKELTTLWGHTDQITSLAFSPDGKALASGSRDKSVKLWRVGTGKAMATLDGHQDVVLSVAFSPDGKTVASGSQDKTVRLWEVLSGKERACFTGHGDRVGSVAFSPDGKTVAAASRAGVRLWDLTTGKEKASMPRDAEEGLELAMLVRFSRTAGPWSAGMGRRSASGTWRPPSQPTSDEAGKLAPSRQQHLSQSERRQHDQQAVPGRPGYPSRGIATQMHTITQHTRASRTSPATRPWLAGPGGTDRHGSVPG